MLPVADSPSSMCLRIATAADLAAVTSVINAAYAVETFIEGQRMDSENPAELMAAGVFLVAENASGRVQACVYTKITDTRGYFGMLAVHPAAQGTGLGRAMVQAAENYCRPRGCSHMDIFVLNLRPELFPFYRKLGYVEAGSKEFRPLRPLKGGVQGQCILMSKAL